MSNRLALSSTLTAILAAAASCGSPPPAEAPPGAPAPSAATAVAATPPARAEGPAPAPPPGLRLPASVAPLRYKLALTVVPAEAEATGSIDIDLTLNEPSSILWLNGTDLTVSSASLEVAGKTVPARVVPGGPELVGFALDAPAPAGAARLHVDFHAVISGKDDHGIFKEKEGDATYVFTQFESQAARRAFPCFDDPSAKVPWQLTLKVKNGDVAVSNTPVLSEAPAEGGMKIVRFAETKPLSTYLVAFAVGPFEMVDAGKAGDKGTPLRIVVPRGRKADARYAAASTKPLLEDLEKYFGIPYPYEKLDVLAIPHTVTFGAMENVGLITFFMAGMLAKPEEDTISFKRRYADIITHELAHQWFGDLVTTAWWDDIWLNEAFATWMEAKIITRFQPSWTYEALHARDRGFVRQGDSLLSARSVRQPIASKDDIANAFDAITYQKGAAVLDMFEAYLGPETFQKGVRRYLSEHAFGNATAKDFLGALSAETGRDVGPAVSTFLDQPGVPLVHAELRCDKGQKPRLELSAERYLPLGSKGKGDERWQIPVCARYDGGGSGKDEPVTCTLLTESKGSLELDKAARCPAWVMPNAGGVGYYNVAYSKEALDRLWKLGQKRLSVVERINLTHDISALARTGKLPAEAAFSPLADLANDPSPHVLEAALDLFGSIREAFVPKASRPSYARFIAKTFGPRARAITWKATPGEDDPIRLLRPYLVPLVAERGDDRALRAEAAALTERWLNDPRSVDDDVVDEALAVTTRFGDRKLWDRLFEAAKKSRDDGKRRHLLFALATFHDPELVRASLALLLTDAFDLREAMRLLFQPEETVDVGFAFLKQNFDALLSRLPAEASAELPYMAAAFCDEAHRAEVEAFWKPRISKIVGGPRILAQVNERIGLCASLRQAYEPSLTAYLKKF
jgi:cytosol alanyl aminopeptidase